MIEIIKELMNNKNVVIEENTDVITIKVTEEKYEDEISDVVEILKENDIEYNTNTYLSLHEDAIYWVNVNKYNRG